MKTVVSVSMVALILFAGCSKQRTTAQALSLIKQQKYEQAIDLLEPMAAEPDASPLTHLLLARSYHFLAQSSHDPSRYRNALEEYRRAMLTASNPHDESVGCTGMGKMFEELDDIDSAFVMYRQAIALDSTNSDASFKAGRLALSRGEDEKAVSFFQGPIQQGTKDLRFYASTAQAQRKMGLARHDTSYFHQALANYDQALGMAKGNARIERALKSERAFALEDMGRFEEALAIFHELQASDSTDTNPFESEAMLYLKQKEYEKAADVYAGMAQRAGTPDKRADYTCRRALMLYTGGQVERCFALIDQAFTMAPNRGATYQFRASRYLMEYRKHHDKAMLEKASDDVKKASSMGVSDQAWPRMTEEVDSLLALEGLPAAG